MKKNYRDHLFESGLLDGKTDQIKAFREAYRKDYKQGYNKAFKKKKKRVPILFDQDEYDYLQSECTKYDMKFAPFLRHLIFAKLSEAVISPSTEKLSEIEELLRNIQNQVTNWTPHLFNNEVSLDHVQELKEQMKDLETYIKNALESIPLEKWLEFNMENDELFLQKLVSTIAKYINS